MSTQQALALPSPAPPNSVVIKGLDPVRAFMVRRWVARLESEVAKAGASEWLP